LACHQKNIPILLSEGESVLAAAILFDFRKVFFDCRISNEKEFLTFTIQIIL
jgi:hypothetical protein